MHNTDDLIMGINQIKLHNRQDYHSGLEMLKIKLIQTPQTEGT